jgi:hypothetical protein
MPGLLIRSDSIVPESEPVSSWERQLARWENEGGRIGDVPETGRTQTRGAGRPGSVDGSAEDHLSG